MNNKIINIGILAIQGSFAEHKEMCEALGYSCIFIRNKDELEKITHLILPGGESTTMLKLLKEFKMWEILKDKIQNKNLKIFGTCAGAILCSHLGMNISIERNAYGAQQNSIITDITVNKNSEFYKNTAVENISAAFIRAPKIIVNHSTLSNRASSLEIISEYKNTPVLVEENNFIACSFHPEITKDYSIYEYFCNK